MTTAEQQVICQLIQAAIDHAAPDHQAMPDTASYASFARQQQLETLLLAGAQRCGHPLSPEEKRTYISHVLISEQQLYMLHRISNAFEQHAIDYLPLKGIILKKMYPKAELRSMSDLDLLIKPEQYDAIKPIMASLGFSEDVESDHELVWRKNNIIVELHKRLIPSYNKDYYAYYGDGWRLARPTDCAHQYAMSPEDTFIYLFTHFAKHYRDKGIGIRQAVDLYVYRRAYPALDMTYVEKQLSLLQLDRFHANVSHMLRVWFGHAAHTEASALISDRLFSGTVFGMEQDGQVSAMLKERNAKGSLTNAKASAWRRMLFPSLAEMKQRYPILHRLPLLLPICWGVRGLDKAFFHRDRITAFQRQMDQASAAAVDAYQDMLHRSGLDFHFK